MIKHDSFIKNMLLLHKPKTMILTLDPAQATHIQPDWLIAEGLSFLFLLKNTYKKQPVLLEDIVD